jgi:hypothetical protein
MPKLSIEIPEEIMNLIEADGYDLHSYFYLVFMRPLLERHQVSLEKEVIAIAKEEIDAKIEAVKESVVVAVEKVEATPDPVPIVEDTPIEPDPEKN